MDTRDNETERLNPSKPMLAQAHLKFDSRTQLIIIGIIIMAASVPTRLGQVNGAGANDALFLKMYAGMVLAAFTRKNQFESRAFIKTITAGKSASFPAIGRSTAAYHTVGSELTGNAINQNEVIITTDGQLVAHEFVAEWDELVNHFETQSIIAAEQGKALATLQDEHLLIELYNGSQAAATVTGLAGGSTITDANLISATDTTRVQALIDAFRVSAQTLDENDAPDEGRFAVLRPIDYYLLVNTAQTNGFSAINADFKGEGSLADGSIFRIDGIDIVKTNNLLASNTGTSGNYTYHNAIMTNVAGLVGVNKCVGVTKLQSIRSTRHDDPRRLGELLVSRQVCGIKALRPECCIALESA